MGRKILARPAHRRVGMEDGATAAVHQEGARATHAHAGKSLGQRTERDLHCQYPAGAARAFDGQREHQAGDGIACAVGQSIGRADHHVAGAQRLAEGNVGRVDGEGALSDRLVIGRPAAALRVEADGIDDRIALLVEEPDHVGALGLLVDEEQRPLARFLIQVGEPQGTGGESERVELVEERALDLVGQLARGEGVDLVELAAQLTLPGGKREDGRERERRCARASEKQGELDPQSHAGIFPLRTDYGQGIRAPTLDRAARRVCSAGAAEPLHPPAPPAPPLRRLGPNA